MPQVPFDQQPRPYIVPPCYREIKILYQDDDLLLIDKPDLLLSVPGRLAGNKDCMISRIQENFPTATAVHRLDLDTSGIMMVPLSHAAHAEITRQFQRRAISKTYTAVLWGIVAEDHGKIELPIVCDWERRPLQKICHETGKWSLTEFKVLERDYDNNCTRVLFHPITGRSHQLRIHSRELGHPILGCDMYAHTEALAAAERLLLHATELVLNHPITGKPLKGYSAPPF